MDDLDTDLARLRKFWRRRRAAAESVRRRIDPRGMTRPARSPEERDWLRDRGELSVFIEEEGDPHEKGGC